MKARRGIGRQQAGFTILELTIAVAVFSIVLLIVAAGLLAFSHAYFQGINASNTQATARSIMDDTVQAVEFGSQTPVTTVNGTSISYCLNNAQYIFKLGQQIGSGGAQHALVRDSTCAPSPALPGGALSATQKELLTEHMRIARFDIKPTGIGAYTFLVQVTVVYGDDDLLVGKTNAGVTVGINGGTNWSNLKEVHCKSQVGSQFCAVANLTSTVQQRITGPGA